MCARIIMHTCCTQHTNTARARDCLESGALQMLLYIHTYIHTLNSSHIIFPPNLQTIVIALMLSLGGGDDLLSN